MKEEDILAAADLIKARRAIRNKIEKAPNGVDFMIRWTVRGTAPGEAAYCSIPVKYEDVEHMIVAHFAQLLLKVDNDLADRYKELMKKDD